MYILVLHPDQRFAKRLVDDLSAYWHVVDVAWAESGISGLQQVRSHPPDVVLLAAALEGEPRFDALRKIRRISDVPVLMLARGGHDAAQVEALSLGADDYLVEPVSAAVLAARIKAIRRRGGLVDADDDDPDFQSGALAMWFGRQVVTVDGSMISLTRLEYRLLYQLVRRLGHVVPSRVLLDSVWGADYGATPKYLKVFINRLRYKLGNRTDVPVIRTERRIGYRLDPRSTLAGPASTRRFGTAR